MNTVDVIRMQLNAMRQQAYEVGLYRAGENANMIPREWTVAALMKSIPWMRYANWGEDRNIYIRPHGEHDLTLIDDLKAAQIHDMRAQGFQPAVVVETSPGNFQAWLKHGQKLDKELSTYVGRQLAQRFGGDQSSADWRHFGRLAGFTNRKPKYLQEDGTYPYVRLREAKNVVYQQAPQFVAEVASRWQQEQSRRQEWLRRQPVGLNSSAAKTIEEFRNDPRYAGDAHRADLAYAVHAVSHGVSDKEIAQAIASRDLSHKGTPIRQEGYIERTLLKAKGRSLRL
jgi:hypothetical protein